MTLGFSRKINGKPTYFVDKIWQCLLRDDVEMNALELEHKLKEALPIIGKTKIGDFPQKKHTIRRDSKNRWKEGNDIHFIIYNRTPARMQFAPVVKVQSIQKIEISYHQIKDWKGFITNNNAPMIRIDGCVMSGSEAEELAINDGFDSLDAFFEWFSEDFTGKIIHWTDKKY